MTVRLAPFVFDHGALYESVQRIAAAATTPPRVSIIAGSGIHAAFEGIQLLHRIPYQELPLLPRTTISGHRGELLLATVVDIPVVVFGGRFHLYEGYSVAEIVAPIVLLHHLGVKYLVLTNAAGGLNPRLTVGDLLLVNDVVNMTFRSLSSHGRGERLTIATAWHLRLQAAAIAAGIPLTEGTYVAVHGPSYETPAEVRFFRRLGDCIGMSTVHELEAARRLGIESVIISVVTNTLSDLPHASPLSHAEVVAVASRAQPMLHRILELAIMTAGNSHEH